MTKEIVVREKFAGLSAKIERNKYFPWETRGFEKIRSSKPKVEEAKEPDPNLHKFICLRNTKYADELTASA